MIANSSHPTMPSSELMASIKQQVQSAIAEDVGSGDLTAQLVPSVQTAKASIIARETAVICGIDWVNACFSEIDPNVKIDWLVEEGAEVKAEQVLCEISGLARSILTAERCALNFLQTLSATATQTRHYVKAIAGTRSQILDTRKTIPNLRWAQKYAVTVGGGANQRLALYDGILIKENHIAAAGSIAAILKQALALNSNKSIQIEVENLSQLAEALQAGASSILLDNFNLDQLRAAVELNQASDGQAILEASGGIGLDNVREIALTGVDRISIGAITKNLQAVDLSMRFHG
jgi:nicotinate-nucleotide pyrophosphorylase (carboxylating)